MRENPHGPWGCLMQSGSDARGRRWGWKKKALLQLALIPAWLLFAELLFRGALWIGGTPFHAVETRTAITAAVTGLTQLAAVPRQKDEPADPATQAFYNVWHAHPFFGFEDYTQLPMVGEDAAAFARPRDPREYAILMVGGSVAWLFTPVGTETLKQKLLEDPRFQGRSIRFLIYARPSFKQPQQLMQVAYLLELGIHPDAVINLDGFNEASYSWSNIKNGVHPAYPDIGIWGHAVSSDPNDRPALDRLLDVREMQTQVTAIANFALHWRLYQSSILGRWTLARIGWRMRRAAEARKQYVDNLVSRDSKSELRGPKLDGGEEAAVALAVRVWIEASRSLQDICRGRSIFYLHVLQPTLHDTGSKPLDPAEIAAAWKNNNPYYADGVHALYPRMKQAGEELRALGVNFLDASMAFADVKQPLYYDNCHFQALGNEIVAARIAEAFLRTLPPSKPPEPVNTKR